MSLPGLLLAAAAAFTAPAALAAPFEDTIAQRTMACTACHGPQGRAAPDGYYPRLAGKPVGYLYNQLLNFRDGRRHYGLMTQLLDPLSDAYLMEIAQYFSALEVPYPAPLPAGSAELVRRGRELVMNGNPAQKLPACVQCHGQAMTGVAPNIPGLLGLPRDYLNAQLGAWRDGQRRAHAPDCMADVIKRLSSDDINAIGTWLAAQPLPADTHPAATLPAPAPGYVNLPCGSAPLAGQAKAGTTAAPGGTR
ncbi:MAG: c-type cytochrome [Comamonadaceae bacterium]|nr:MAG: c-type cytochrome [Comamonadaceae bacterium]